MKKLRQVLQKKVTAVLYLSQQPPGTSGALKPMKVGGYSDSGADIIYQLKQNGLETVTFKDEPIDDIDFCFPDSHQGIQDAIDKGVDTFWLNTVLYKDHPINSFSSINVVGQDCNMVDVYDNKWNSNSLMQKNGIPIPESIIIYESWNSQDIKSYLKDFKFPLILKPILGRGSQGVSLINNFEELFNIRDKLINSKLFGNNFIIEEYLNGQEITITVMPPGSFLINNQLINKYKHWSLPVVKRWNQLNGIAPNNQQVPVTLNSSLLNSQELDDKRFNIAQLNAEKVAELINSKAPIRIDGRCSFKDNFKFFDLNLKPNMTGKGRKGRELQNSLTAIAAEGIGWDYTDLILNIWLQNWELKKINNSQISHSFQQVEK